MSLFNSAQRARQHDRARLAPNVGHLGRDVGDQPYIMDLVSFDHFGGGQHSGLASAATGTGSIGTFSTGPTAVLIQTGATASSTLIYDWGTNYFNMNGYQRDANLRARMLFSAIDANSKLFVGLGCSHGLASAVDGVFFGIDGSTSTTNFIAVSRKSGAATTRILDGGGGTFAVPVDSTIWHDILIVCDSTAGQVRYYVDRQLVATITTDLPSAASDYMGPVFSAENGATATNRSLYCDVLVLAEAGP